MIMAICVPKYEIQELSENEATQVQTPEEFVVGVQTEIAKRFMYEPMTEETVGKMRGFLESRAARCGFGASDVEIDFMPDLAGKAKECAGCRQAGSYEEYKIRRAASGLPDEAGSEREWFRMASYSDGSALVNINLVAPRNAEPLEISFKIVS